MGFTRSANCSRRGESGFAFADGLGEALLTVFGGSGRSSAVGDFRGRRNRGERRALQGRCFGCSSADWAWILISFRGLGTSYCGLLLLRDARHGGLFAFELVRSFCRGGSCFQLSSLCRACWTFSSSARNQEQNRFGP